MNLREGWRIMQGANARIPLLLWLIPWILWGCAGGARVPDASLRVSNTWNAEPAGVLHYRDEVSLSRARIQRLIDRLRSDGKRVLAASLEEFAEDGVGFSMGAEGLDPSRVLDQARSYLGVIHCMGGNTRRCMDCSGMVSRTFRDFGVPAPQGSQNLAHFGEVILDPAQLRPGDMVFFEGTYNTTLAITHSGLYLGSGMFIHTSAKFGVEIRDMFASVYWMRHFLFGTRVMQVRGLRQPPQRLLFSG